MMAVKLFEEINLVEVADYIYSTPFLTPDFANYIMHKCINLNTWGSEANDPLYETQDIYFQEELPEVFAHMVTALKGYVYPELQELFFTEIPDPYQIFAIKYAKGLQTNLSLHRDDSFVSGSIKLNNDYEGAELYFPEQKFSNKDVNVGDLILWPATITHPHKCEELIKGEKYSITIWTPYPKIQYDLLTEGEINQRLKRRRAKNV